MERTNPVAHPVHELLAKRWSPRAFDGRPVEAKKLRSLMEAARWSPSASNEQPWAFIVGTIDQPAEHQRVLSCLVEKNQSWAKHAPVLMIAAAFTNFRRHDAPNRHAAYDLGQAVAHMTSEATNLGLHVHQMAGFSPDAARQAFAIPPAAEAITALAVGYLGDPVNLPEDLRQREAIQSTRKPATDFVFATRWGQPAPWVAGV